MAHDARRDGIAEQLIALKQATGALGIVDFNERKQHFFCRVCRYRDPLYDGNKLHDDNCPWLEYLNLLESVEKAVNAALLSAVRPAPEWEPIREIVGWTCRSNSQVQWWKKEHDGAVIVRHTAFSTAADAEKFCDILKELLRLQDVPSPPIDAAPQRTTK